MLIGACNPTSVFRHWVQQHFHEFEITLQLRTDSPGFPADAVIDQDRAARSRVDARFLDDYRDLLVKIK